MNHYRIRVYGKVQGVFYRASTKKAATALGIHGWVKNEEDGSVLISAEGSELQLTAFIDWCKTGPAHAQVTEVLTDEIAPEGFEDFRVVY